MPSIQTIARQTRRGLFGVSGIVDDLRAQWDKGIADFQSAREQLTAAESQLYDVHPIAKEDPADLAEWQRLFDKVNLQMSVMDSAANAVSTVAGWFASATSWIPGMSGMRRDGALGALGLAPFALPITLGGLLALTAGAVAAIAGVSSFVTYIATKSNRLAEMRPYIQTRTQELIDIGVPPERAATQAFNEANKAASDEARETSGFGFGGTIRTVMLWGAVIAIAVFVAPKLIERMK